MSQDFFYINTPLGTLSCDAVPDDEFPSVRLYVNGIPVAVLEYVSYDNKLVIQTYRTPDMDDEEPMITELEPPKNACNICGLTATGKVKDEYRDSPICEPCHKKCFPNNYHEFGYTTHVTKEE